MADGPVTTTSGATYIPEIWSLEVIDAYAKNVVLSNLVDRSYQELARAGHGNIINVPASKALTVGAITQGSNVTQVDDTAEGEIIITVSTWEGGRLSFPDIVAVQTMASLRTAYTSQLGIAMALAIDDDLATLVSSFAQTVGTLVVNLTDDNILRARQYLDDANAPNEDRYIVVTPAQLMSFYKEDKYANSLYRGTTGNLDGKKGRGYIGPLYNTDVYECSNLTANDNTMFQKKAMALVIQKGPAVEMWRNVAALMDEIVIHAIWGVREMRDTSGVWMKGL